MQHLARTLLPGLARLVVVSFLALSLAVLGGCGEASPEPEVTAPAAPTTLPTTTPVPPTATAIPPTATAVPPTATPLPPTTTPVPPTPTAVPPTPVPDTGSWLVLRDQDAMTDRRQVAVGLYSDSYEPVRGAADKATLVIACNYGGDDPPRWAAVIGWDRIVATRNTNIVSIAVRFGDEPVQARPAGLSADRTTSIVLRVRTLAEADFLNDLQQHARFAAQVRRYDDTIITATWDVTGLTAALQPLREHCP